MWYYRVRVNNPDCYIIPSASHVLSRDELIFYISMNTFFIMVIAFYSLFYARVYESFGMFVRLCI